MCVKRECRNLGVMIDDQLTFKVNVASIAQSRRFDLYNIRKIRPYLSEHATQLLVQALVISRIDYCSSLLVGLPACTFKPLQMIQNAAARLVINQPKRAHVTPLFISLHCSYPSAVHIPPLFISLHCSYPPLFISLRCSYPSAVHIPPLFISLHCSYPSAVHIPPLAPSCCSHQIQNPVARLQNSN